MKRRIKLADGTLVWIEGKSTPLPAGATEAPEPATSEELDAKIEAAVAKAFEPIEKALKAKASDNTGGMPTAVEGARPVITGRDMKSAAEGTGLNLARYVKAMAAAKMMGMTPEAVAKGWGYADVAAALGRNKENVSKALAQGTLADGGAFVPIEYSTELIELLRNATVIRKAGARTVPMGATLEIPSQTAGATAYWGQENTAITPSQQTTAKVVLQEKKLTALTVVSNDLIRNASISAEEFVRNDLLNVMGIAEDLAFLRGTGASSAPTGIRYRATSGNIYDETTASDGAPTLAELKKEFNKALKLMKQANVPMLKCAWIMNAQAELGVLDVVGPGAEGYNSLEREMVERGTIRGKPYFVTEQIPHNLNNDGDEGELYLVDFNEVIIGDSMAMELMVFPNGGDDGITKDQTTIRAIRKMDLQLRHTSAAVVVTGLTWGQ